MKTNNIIINSIMRKYIHCKGIKIVARLTSIITLLILGVNSVKADETLTLAQGSITGSYSTGTMSQNTSASNSIGLSWARVLYSSSAFQLEASNGEIHSTSYPSTNSIIKSITVSVSTNTAYLYGSDDGETWTQVGFTSGTAKDVEDLGFRYFKVTSTGSYCKISGLVVTYTTPTYYTITYYDKDGSHSVEALKGSLLTKVLAREYSGTDPVSCNTTIYPYFFGWKASTIDGATTTKPSILVDERVSGTATYYAVWTDVQPVWSAASSIAAGDVVLFCYVEGSTEKEMVDIAGDLGVADDFDSSPTGAFPLYVETGNGGTGFSFRAGLSYLKYQANGKLHTSFTKDNNSSWNVSFSGTTSTIANVASSSYSIQYNTSSPRFVCYSSAQAKFQIYKKTQSGTPYYITTCAACEVNPILGTPTLTSITSGTITVSCPSISAGENCTISDYGFVWKASSQPNIGDNKTQVGTDNRSTAYNSALSISFTTGTTYNIKAYATNGQGTTLSTTLAVTPRSVTFNSNGGSPVATQYVNNGGTVNAPSDPTKSGFVFGGWYQESGLSTPVDWSAAITADKTYYAKWLTYGNYVFTCAELTLEAHPETADAPIFITSVAGKKVRSQGYIQITGSGLTPNTTLTFPSLPATLFEIKTATYGDLATDASGAIDAAAYIFYTPAADATSDGLDKITGITVTVGGAKTKTVSLEQVIIGRHLPADFVIAAKKDGKWYALPSNMESTSHPAPSEIAVDNTTNPAIAYTDASNKYGLEGPTTGASGNIKSGVGQYVKLTMHPLSDAPLFGMAPSNTAIGKSGTAVATHDLSAGYWWQLKQTNTSITNPQDAKYTIYCANNTSSLSIKDNAGSPEWGLYASGIEELRLIPASSIVFAEAEIVEWGQNGAIIEVDATAINATKVKALLNGSESSIVTVSTTGTSVKGTATKYNYTAAFGEGIDFADAESNGAMLTLEWYNSSNVLVGVSNINVPKIIANNITINKTNYPLKSDWNTEVHVLPGKKVIIEADYSPNPDVTIKELNVYPGATVDVESGTLVATALVMRNGWTRVSGKEYNVARLYIKPTDGNMTTSNAYSDWYIDFDQYYPIAVPWEVTIANMSYKNTSGAASVGIGTSNSVRLRYYDGDSRATNVQTGVGDGANWKAYGDAGADPVPAKLLPAKGYAMTAKRPTGKAFSIVRMPMTIPSADWTTGGEKGAVSSVHKDQVTVTAYDSGSTPEYAKGWNFIANPYMALYQGTLNYTDAGSIAYANIPDINFQEYDQVPINGTNKLKPSSGFLVQAPKTGTVTFGTASRVASAPSYRTEQQPEDTPEQQAYITLKDDEAEDMMGILVADKYTEAYESNADLQKLLGSGTSLKTYMHYGDLDMAYLAINAMLAKEWIPVLVRIPSDGEYTFSLHSASVVGELEGVYLIDYENGNQVTNLIEGSYTFYAEAGTNSSRFAINAIVGARVPTDIDAIEAGADTTKPVKFIYRENVYIWLNGVIYDATGKRVKGGAL